MLEPMQDVLVLELINVGGDTTLVLPDSHEPEKQEGQLFKVIASGPGYWDSGKFISNTINAGDKVITASYGISKFTWEGKKIILARERDVILRLNGKGKK